MGGASCSPQLHAAGRIETRIYCRRDAGSVVPRSFTLRGGLKPHWGISFVVVVAVPRSFTLRGGLKQVWGGCRGGQVGVPRSFTLRGGLKQDCVRD